MMRARGQGGFTLVEILVALSLLALVGLISWRGLDHVAGQRARADAETLAADRVLRTLAQIERDFGQRIPDALFVRSQGVGSVLPLALQVATDEEGQVRLRVLRRYPGLRGARDVTYDVEDFLLVRRLAAEDASGNADTVPLLDAVLRLGVRFLVEGQWVEPRLLQSTGRRATAIELAIEREDGERYVQVLQL